MLLAAEGVAEIAVVKVGGIVDHLAIVGLLAQHLPLQRLVTHRVMALVLDNGTTLVPLPQHIAVLLS